MEEQGLDPYLPVYLEQHKILDQIAAAWISETGKIPSEGSVMELLIWSHERTKRGKTPGV